MLVQLAPNHASIADPDALRTAYASGSLKDDFYYAPVSIHRGVSNRTCDQANHTRKRKPSLKPSPSRAYSSLSLTSVCVSENCSDSETNSLKGLSGKEGKGWVWFDCILCKSASLYLDSAVRRLVLLVVHFQGTTAGPRCQFPLRYAQGRKGRRIRSRIRWPLMETGKQRLILGTPPSSKS